MLRIVYTIWPEGLHGSGCSGVLQRARRGFFHVLLLVQFKIYDLHYLAGLIQKSTYSCIAARRRTALKGILQITCRKDHVQHGKASNEIGKVEVKDADVEKDRVGF